ncbi:MAG TPA: laccase domain-containing protein, partial [Macromonas sp.]|nr:laccase domain-containing protein [Macromonas sp.]
MPHPLPAPLHDALLPTTSAWPEGVQAVFTTRQAGCSAPPYNSWNQGDHVGDAHEQVKANRRLLAERTGARPVFLNQVHGCDVVELRADTPDGTVADACWT